MSADAAARERDAGGEELARWRDFLTPAGLVALGWTLFQVAIVVWPTVEVIVQRGGHVCFAVALALLTTGRRLRSASLRAVNLGLAGLAFLPFLWLVLEQGRIEDRYSGLDPLLWGDWAGAILLLLLLFEASRRVMGLGITLFAALCVAYQLLGAYAPGALAHRATGLAEFLDVQFLTVDGLFGVPTGVSVEIVFYFILFAAVYEVYGGGRLIIELALSLTGNLVGGPAKAAILSSGLMGSVSGSAVANVMSTGIFTIPLMKRINYDPRFAGAVEAVASTGGQIMPPVMGAAAFVMADYLRIPYREIVLAAALPAILYYLSLVATVDLEARKRRLGRLPRAELPRILPVLAERGHMLLPLLWLVYRIVTNYGITFASIEAILLTILCGMARRTTRAPAIALLRSGAVTAQRTVNVALPCAVAGVIVSVIAYTGLGTKFTGLVVQFSGGSLELTLLLAMAASLVLGAGMPTTSAYIMGAVLIAPSLVQLGLEPILAHFFVFYFSILSMITPPVALAAYAAASISGASSAATGWKAVALAIPCFLVPYGFLLHPGLLLLGGAEDAVWGFVSLLVAFFGLAVAVIGWLVRPLHPAERGLFAALGLFSIYPHLLTTLAAALGMAGLCLWLRAAGRRAVAAVRES